MNNSTPTLIPSTWTGSTFRIHLFLIYLFVSGIAVAAHEVEEKPPEAASPQTPVEDVAQKIIIPEYVTPLQSFRKYVESDEPDWKAANDLVGEIGGWRAYAREAFLAEREEREATKKAAMEKTTEQNETEPQAEENTGEGDDDESNANDMKTPEGESE